MSAVMEAFPRGAAYDRYQRTARPTLQRQTKFMPQLELDQAVIVDEDY